jgi:hypothetical protein
MADALFTNNAFSTLASGINDSVTALTVASSDGALFPNPTGGNYFYATLIDTSGNIEIIKCTTRSTDAFSVIVREQEGTTARAFSTADRVELRLTAASLTELRAGITASANDANTVLDDEVNTFTAAQRGSITALSDGANISTNFALNNHFSVTLAGNRTLDNPSNIVAGQSGSIFVTQDGTGSRTLAYGSQWDFVGGTAPTLSTTASAIDRIDYVVRTTSSIHAIASLAVS